MQITQQLRQVVYEGDRKGSNFDKYVAAHVEAHNNVEALHQCGYTGLPGFEKVDLFLSGIRVPEFDTCRNQLLTDPTIMSDFGCINFIAFVHQKAAIAPPCATTRQVSAVSGAGRGRGRMGRGQDRGCGARRGCRPSDPDARRLGLADQRDVDSCVIENRDYSKAKYDQLTRAQRQKLGNCAILTVPQALDHLVPEGVPDQTAVQLDTTGPPVHPLQVHHRLLHVVSLPLLAKVAATIAGRYSLTTLK
jgi:hypothetical protein